MSVFSSAYNMLRSTVGPLAERAAQSRAATVATAMAKSEWGAARGFYAAASGRPLMRGLSAAGSYMASNRYRAVGTAAALTAAGMAIAPPGRHAWGFWGGPLGGATARVWPDRRRRY